MTDTPTHDHFNDTTYLSGRFSECTRCGVMIDWEDEEEETVTAETALAYLNRDGNLRVPCSRYGSDTFECSPVAVEAAEIIARESGEALTLELAEYIMGLVVNDHDDVAYMLDNYGETNR